MSSAGAAAAVAPAAEGGEAAGEASGAAAAAGFAAAAGAAAAGAAAPFLRAVSRYHLDPAALAQALHLRGRPSPLFVSFLL